jgi:hypothetical protein
MTRKKIFHIIYFLLTVFVVFAIAQQSEFSEIKQYTDNKYGGDCILKSSYVNIEDATTAKTFEIEVPIDGEYYLSAWVMNTGITQKNNGLKFYLDDQKSLGGYIQPQEEGWQITELCDNKTSKIKKLNLSSGRHSLKFCSTIPEVPQIEFIRLSQNERNVKISESCWNEFIEKAKNNILPSDYVELKEESLRNLKLLKILPNPEGNYLHDIDAYFTYSYASIFYFSAGSNVTLETKRSDPCASDPVMYLFNSYDPVNKGSWSNDDGGECVQSKITCTIQYSGTYWVFIRSYSSNSSQTTNLYLNDELYASNIVISGAKYYCYYNSSELINYFTFTKNVAQGDPKLWIEGTYNYKILAYNDDYGYAYGDFNWQQNARVKKSFNQMLFKCLLTSSSTYYPTGYCDLFMKCKSSYSDLHSSFPNLEEDDAIMSANTNNDKYNCISWSGGRTTLGRWFWPPNYGNPWYSSDELTAFDNFYGNRDDDGFPLCRGQETETGIIPKAMNITRTGATATNACVALWKYYSYFTHGSVKKPSNDQPHGYDWESKPGGLLRTFHPRHALNGSSYGDISDYYRWDGTWTEGTPPAKIAETNAITLKLYTEFTNNDKEKLNSLISEIASDVDKNFELKYNEWKVSWNNPELKIYSNPKMFAESNEYKNLIAFCKSKGKQVWPLIIKKYEKGDELCINLFEDLTFHIFPDLMNQIRKSGNTYARSKGLIPSQSSNWTSYALSILAELSSSDIKNAKPDTSESELNPNKLQPNKTLLEQNYPNPFNMSTKIRFYLTDNQHVSLKIYNRLGQEVKTLINTQLKSSGWHSATWNGTDKNGNVVSTGIYIYKLILNNQILSKKLLIIK